MVTRAGRNTGVAVEEAASQQSSADELEQAALAHKQAFAGPSALQAASRSFKREFKREWYLQRTFPCTNNTDLRNPHAEGHAEAHTLASALEAERRPLAKSASF